ncbi:hypothetical protein GPUN_2094 [Glaciecola punicea ACAM 611]|uniref:Uncharacterized protein n=1 Tax=Glaciecola punicea ACAM 611 TaxID=1121923 RepID=H5TD32_9ALTE|nr:hypothetical protein [Glaciecola punicea]GAB56209.1 hypothetical protein GPUN_2094 [Glaciecola punicea ACAM 611]
MFIIRLIIGIALIVGGVIAQAAWLGVCFGTVIIGVLLIFIAPGILFFPFTFGLLHGLAIIKGGDSNT